MSNDDASRPVKTSPGHLPHGLASGADLPPGYIVGEYRIDSAVGRGGMGVVYAATQPVIEKRVAIKVLHVQFSSDPALTRRFVDEARAVNRVRHENIIDIFSFGQLPDGRHYFVMEYLEGSTMGEAIERATLDLQQVPSLLFQVCDALDAAHSAGIVHRDLKPENIWILTPRHGRQMIKLLDFGIAKLASAGDQNVTQTGVVMGTPHYMSPEQCYGRNVDHRTDIYALGVLLYRIYAGRFPFEGETFTEIIAKHVTAEPEPPARFATIPAALDRLIVECLAKDVTLRPQSTRDLSARLSAIFSPGRATRGLPLAATAAQIPAATQHGAGGSGAVVGRRDASRWMLFAGAGLVVMLGVAAVLWMNAARTADQASRMPIRTHGGGANTSTPGDPTVPRPSTGAQGPGVQESPSMGSPAAPSPPVPAAKDEARADERPANAADSASARIADSAAADELASRRKATGASQPKVTPPMKAPIRSRASDRGLVTDNPFE